MRGKHGSRQTGMERSLGGLFAALALAAAVAGGCGFQKSAIPPARLAAEGGRITLKWDPVPGAVAYNVYFAAAPGVTKQNGIRIENAGNPITIQELERGRRYWFVVTAIDGQGRESAESEEISHTAE